MAPGEFSLMRLVHQTLLVATGFLCRRDHEDHGVSLIHTVSGLYQAYNGPGTTNVQPVRAVYALQAAASTIVVAVDLWVLNMMEHGAHQAVYARGAASLVAAHLAGAAPAETEFRHRDKHGPMLRGFQNPGLSPAGSGVQNPQSMGQCLF